jgi:hypothetical protein
MKAVATTKAKAMAAAWLQGQQPQQHGNNTTTNMKTNMKTNRITNMTTNTITNATTNTTTYMKTNTELGQE